MSEAIVKRVEERKPSSFMNLIHIALDDYDDIFSDFDPTEYEKRALSDDLTKELQKRYAETSTGEIELRFSIPSALRSAKVEHLIKKRLHEYFIHQVKMLDHDTVRRKRRGLTYFIMGFMVLLFTLYSIEVFVSARVHEIISLMLTPLGWFGMWEGINMLLEVPFKVEDQRKFYTTLSRANYIFINEEDFVKEVGKKEVSGGSSMIDQIINQ